MTRLAIVGTREFVNPHWQHLASTIILGALYNLQPEVVISGGAPGIDSLATSIAGPRGFRVVEHRPTIQQWDGPGGYQERNARIAQDCTDLLSIRCTEATSYGSGWTADEAERLGRTVHRRLIHPADQIDVWGWSWCGLAAEDPHHPDWHAMAGWNRSVFDNHRAQRDAEFAKALELRRHLESRAKEVQHAGGRP